MTTIAPPSATDQAPAPTTRAPEMSVVTGGVDTHADTHTAAALDGAGRLLGCATFPATGAGYGALVAWLRSFGMLVAVGVEGTGAYGAGLSAHLGVAGVVVREVNRPDRSARRFAGKADPIDAEAAARAVLAGVATAAPKDRASARGAQVEALRVLRIARRSAVDQRAQCLRQLKGVLVTAPEALRARLRALGDRVLLATCAALRPETAHVEQVEQATKVTLRALARRHGALAAEVTDLDALIAPLVAAINPRLLALNGVGADVAGQLLVTAGANCERIYSEAAFAMLCGVAPLPASSGKTRRHRLNRGGDRQANAALYRVTLCRLRWDERTRAYTQRRTTEGLSKKEIIRCLKRIIAREIYYVLRSPDLPDQHISLAA